MLGFERWQPGTATVVARRLLKESRSTDTRTKLRKFEFILDVRPDDGSMRFRATCSDWLHDPVQGDEVPVLLKVRRQKVKLVSSRALHERRVGRSRRAPADESRWQRMLADEPGSAPPPKQDP